MKFTFLIAVFISLILHLKAVPSEECQKKPKELHCIIEYAASDRFPHFKRYMYDWAMNKCFLIRWSDHCATPAANVNNFVSESECQRECGGWA